MTDADLSTEPPTAAIAELLTWLRARFGDDVELAAGPERAHAGMDTAVYFLELRGVHLDDAWRAPLVIRIHRSPDRATVARHEAAAQDWCIDHQYPAPRILLVGTDEDGFTAPMQVMTRAPGITMLDAITKRPWRARRALQQLGALQARLHSISSADWPDQEVAFAQHRLGPVHGWAVELHDPEVDAALAAVLPIAVALDAGPASMCHGDFHPLNVIVDGDAATVIDWTDAGLGDPMGDITRTALLLRVAGVATTQPVLRAALSALAPAMSYTYLRAYRRAAPFDAHRFEQWRAVHLLHGWTQVRALHAGLVGTEAERSQIPAGLADWLHGRFDRALAAL